jgi:hypothetical protein
MLKILILIADAMLQLKFNHLVKERLMSNQKVSHCVSADIAAAND